MKKILLLTCVLIYSMATAQHQSDPLVKDLNSQEKKSSLVGDWKPIGPTSFINTGSISPGLGPLNIVIKDTNNPNTFYAGAPSGGLWKSTDDGATWTTTTDNLSGIGVSGIAIDPNNSDIIYISGDDGDERFEISPGVFKSTDAGLTWNTTGLSAENALEFTHSIHVSKNDSQTIVLATSKGVYKSSDGGENWIVANGTSDINIVSLEVHPSNPNIMYCTANEPNVYPSIVEFYKSTDGGNSFIPVSNGLPTAVSGLNLSNSYIAVTPASPNVVYIFFSQDFNSEFQGVYKSTNSGDSFTQVASSANNEDVFRAFSSPELAFTVSDTDENLLYIGANDIWKGIISGTTNIFTQVNNHRLPNDPAYTHIEIKYINDFNGELLVASGGGFYRSKDEGNTFEDLTAGMQIGQFNSVAVSKQSSDKMVGGAASSNGGFALNNGQWQNYFGSLDGAATAIDPTNFDKYYGLDGRGMFLYISNLAGAATNIAINPPSGQLNFNNAVEVNSDGEVYVIYDQLYRLDGNAYTKISNVNIPNGGSFENLEIDDSNPDIIYTSNAINLYKSTDRGVTMNIVSEFNNAIRSIEVNNDNSDIVYVNVGDDVLKSTDGGNNFTSIRDGLPGSLTINVIKHHKSDPKNTLYLGTKEVGIYKYDDDTLIWELFNNGLPNVSITDLEINSNDQKITAATFGRGIWQLSLNDELPSNDIKLVSVSGINNSTGINNNTITCNDRQITPELLVKNNGLNTINEIEITYNVDGTDTVFNWTGDLAFEATETIELPQLNLSKGVHDFKITTTIANDFNITNNGTLQQIIVVNDAGTLNTINTFESSSDELLSYSRKTSVKNWQRGIPTGTLLNDSNNPTNNVYGTNLSGVYGNEITAYLVSECYDLTTLQGQNPILKFDMAFQLELGFDVAYAEYSLNEGVTWDVLGTANDPNWYNSDAICSFCTQAGQWNGTETTLQEYSYNLSAFDSETKFQYRFVLKTDQSLAQEGVIIDNPIITTASLSVNEFETSNFLIHPNPSKGIFNIKTTVDTFNYGIYDVTGKQLVEQKQVSLNNGNYKLDISNYASGIYFLNITTANSKVTKKLILE